MFVLYLLVSSKTPFSRKKKTLMLMMMMVVLMMMLTMMVIIVMMMVVAVMMTSYTYTQMHIPALNNAQGDAAAWACNAAMSPAGSAAFREIDQHGTDEIPYTWQTTDTEKRLS